MGRHRRRTTIVKAAQPAPVTFTADQVAALVTARQRTAAATQARPLPRLEAPVPFGPGSPMLPAAINPPRPDTGRPEPRRYEYPVAANLPGFGDRLVPWKVLRDAADQIGIFRRCIEIRKNEVATLGWDVVISPNAVERARQASPGTSRRDVERAMRERLEPEITRCVDFWEHPDRRNGYDFIAWAKSILEEHFVLDAVAVYPRLTLGGDLFGFEVLDGSTVKPLLDAYGGRPLPPQPAYQQILYGFPRGEYVADVGDDGLIADAYPADRLIYRVANVRTWTPYGYSAVEQALDDGDLYLRRHGWLKAEFTDGVMPAGWLRAGAGQADWSATQLADYERALNDYYSGQTALRQRFRILPYGMEPDARPDIGEKYKPDYDLHLIKLVASHFDTTLAELGWTEPGGLGSSGWHEGQADVQDRKGTRPTLAWLQSLVTDISRTFLRMPRELEFRILGLDSDDEDASDEVADRRVKSGRMTVNEDRDRIGMPRFDMPEADQPMVYTASGPVPLAPHPANAADQGGADDDEATAIPGDDKQRADETEPDQAHLVKADAELAAYRRWSARRGTRPARPFRFEHLTKAAAVGAGVDLTVVEFTAKGGGAGPKAPAWPGWEQDLAVADRWTLALSQASRGALDTDQILVDYLAARPAETVDEPNEPDPGQVADAEQWLHEQDGGALAAAILAVLLGLYVDGYLVGTLSAGAVLAAGTVAGTAGVAVDWLGWKPGDTERAEEILDRLGHTRDVELLKQAARDVASAIAGTRLDAVARALAMATAGHPVDTITADLRRAAGDPQWARTVAITETTRASSTGALATYRAAGVTDIRWVTEHDERVCPICHANEAEGPAPIGHPFPSGDIAPPGHPRCRCAPHPA